MVAAGGGELQRPLSGSQLREACWTSGSRGTLRWRGKQDHGVQDDRAAESVASQTAYHASVAERAFCRQTPECRQACGKSRPYGSVGAPAPASPHNDPSRVHASAQSADSRRLTNGAPWNPLPARFGQVRRRWKISGYGEWRSASRVVGSGSVTRSRGGRQSASRSADAVRLDQPADR